MPWARGIPAAQAQVPWLFPAKPSASPAPHSSVSHRLLSPDSDLHVCLDPFLQSRLLRAAASMTFGAIEHDDISNLVGPPAPALSHKPAPGRCGHKLPGADPGLCLPFLVMQRMHVGNLEGLLWCLLSSAPSLDRLNVLWEVSRIQRGWARGGTACSPVTCTSLSQCL